MSIRAEAALVGALVIDPEAVARVRRVASPSDFASDRLRPVYAAALALDDAGVPPDYVALCAALEARGALAAIGGDWVVTACVNECPTSLHAEHYARAVASEAAARRQRAGVRDYALPTASGGVVL